MLNRIRRRSQVTLKRNDRYAIVGKTGSGKTTFAVELATKLVPAQGGDWQVWWLDTKGDLTDLERLRRNHFVSYGLWTRPLPNAFRKYNRLYFVIRPKKDQSVYAQAQAVMKMAMERKKVVLVVDEYTHVIASPRNAGFQLENIFRTGRGLDVGLIGNTQEPVYVPRQLLSQASHVFLFDLFYPADQKYARDLYEGYVRPIHPHGLHHGWVDGRTDWHYYSSVRTWLGHVRTPQVVPEQQKEGNKEEHGDRPHSVQSR